ncbi:MAG: substrate-binding domain-containing protein [Oscillospiraceae bacterium]|jgi:ribose transport system substrate-binding protein|nr:substrate-binding domain-containing protein [Oscillospiraceae bacterium]
MRKLLALLVCALMAFGAFSVASAEGELVYLITMDRMDQHWVAVDQGAKDMAAALGLNYKWDAPETKDNAQQIEALNNAVSDGASLILLAANDPVAISMAVKAAKDAGVKIIYVDSGANEPAVATLSTDNYNAGKLAGTTLLNELAAAGVTSGKIGIVSVNTATNSTMQREGGFRDAIAADGQFEVLETEYKDGDAAASQEAATNFINANADLVGLFGANEGSTVGVGNAVKASGDAGIIGVGFDKSDAILGLLADGSLKAAMAQNPYTMGYLGMAQAYAAINGLSTGPAVIDTGVAVLTK